jgi:hypothetical protein
MDYLPIRFERHKDEQDMASAFREYSFRGRQTNSNYTGMLGAMKEVDPKCSRSVEEKLILCGMLRAGDPEH